MNPDPSRLHQPHHAVALDHARDHLRRACSAIAAADVPDARQQGELWRLYARLPDELIALETLERPL